MELKTRDEWNAHYTALRVLPSLMTQGQFKALPEYSASIPTGQYLGKQWRSTDGRGHWWIREYVPCDIDGQIEIRSTTWIRGMN